MNNQEENEPLQNNAEQEEQMEPTPEIIDEDIVQIEKLRQEASEFKHKYLHALADSENTRKRLQKDRDELVQYNLRNLLLDFLNPIDHMENALKYTDDASDEVKHWAIGFKMILSQFKDVLSNNGVKAIESLGKKFDPHLHEAVEMIETTEHQPGIVVEENIRGYVIGEKTLRPARVKVSKTPAEVTPNAETAEKDEK